MTAPEKALEVKKVRKNGETDTEKVERRRLKKFAKIGKQAEKEAAASESSAVEVSLKKSKDDQKRKKEKRSKKDEKEKKEKKETENKEISSNGVPDSAESTTTEIEVSENSDKSLKKSRKEKESKKRRVDDLEEAAAVESKKSKQSIQATVTSRATDGDIDKFLKDSAITISDPLDNDLKPVLSFEELTIDERVLGFLKKYPKPTPIQSASWPFLLASRDLIGVAETGSGKTMAFAVPAVAYLISTVGKRKMKAKDASNISVLIISPTRELALQIHENLDALGKAVNVKSVCVYGGVSKDDQKRALNGANIVVATPGRLIDLVNDEAIDLKKISYLVLDEADRMLEKGFEEDIKRIMRSTDAENRKTVMFTATWPRSVRDLASQFLKNPVKVMIGDRESELKANARIEQVVEVMDPRQKEQRLLQLLRQYQSGANQNDKILIFALYKKEAARVERSLQAKGYKIAAIHGDLSQAQRTSALENFKTGSCKLLLATDVAARGLDIPAVTLVINLTFPLTAEDYVHRIGRTGRAGQSGKAITFFTEHEKHLSGALINVLRSADQPVPEELLKFGGHTKKKEHSVYGAFYKNVDSQQKAKKIIFD
ncbi:P-loop containing nucleoside triphosphate hydrolase protein [Lipomyces chichibuensis]|uniref:P-loop containing nucleoside triphosphate hydrolase protein n=1 Tax=Lipomyces chichibuensis TaxID=1546026 RepID=UPI003343E9D4